VADTLRKGGKPARPGTAAKEAAGPGNQDQTDPEMVTPLIGPQPAASAAAAAPASAPVRSQSPILQAATQIVGSGPIALEPTPAPVGRSIHEDPTTMRGSQRTGAPGRGEPAVPIAETERPKVWVATHKAPPDPDPRLILVREPDSVRAASFRVMRHRVAERGDPRVIAVTGPGARDGKTTTAANLALALSEFGRARVLLVEANLRAPQIAVLFGFLPPECFSVQLQRHRERPMDPWSIVEAFSPSLHVLAVKPGESNRPLLDAPAFAIAIDALIRVGYDYIVIDTPAVLGSADVNLIEDYVDAVILTARSGRTMGRSLRAAVEQLSPRKLLGVMLLDA
jgi:Mrp family chromosome partitioning ATPase